MTKIAKLATAPAQIEAVAESSAPAPEAPTIRDEFAMRAMAAIISGLVERGGSAGLAAAASHEDLLRLSYSYADSAMRVRAAA